MKWWPFNRRTGQASEPVGIRAFNALTVHFLGKLYGSFPEPIDIDPLHEALEWVWAVLQQDPRPPEIEKAFPKYLSDTLKWLEVEGFLRVGGKTDGRFRDVVLTERALRAMGRIPTAIKGKGAEKRPLGELMREASIQQGAALPGELVKALLSGWN